MGTLSRERLLACVVGACLKLCHSNLFYFWRISKLDALNSQQQQQKKDLLWPGSVVPHSFQLAIMMRFPPNPPVSLSTRKHVQ